MKSTQMYRKTFKVKAVCSQSVLHLHIVPAPWQYDRLNMMKIGNPAAFSTTRPALGKSLQGAPNENLHQSL